MTYMTNRKASNEGYMMTTPTLILIQIVKRTQNEAAVQKNRFQVQLHGHCDSCDMVIK